MFNWFNGQVKNTAKPNCKITERLINVKVEAGTLYSLFAVSSRNSTQPEACCRVDVLAGASQLDHAHVACSRSKNYEF